MKNPSVLLPVALLPAALLLGACSQFRDPAPETLAADEVGEELPPEPVTPPLDFSGFNAGNIISDEVFYNSSAMSPEDITAFLSEVNFGCREGAAPCITNYVEDTQTYGGGDYCYDFEGQEADTPGSIIWKAGQACGINPQALLVMLQKEQGLLTASSSRLDQSRYDIAMGYGCPDTANCDPQFFGFANQVFHAAKQLRRYAAEPSMFSIVPERENQIRFHPNASCGEAAVFVENYATAGLYNYTPYQPGGGAGCESSGNANFYAYFNAWFAGG